MCMYIYTCTCTCTCMQKCSIIAWSSTIILVWTERAPVAHIYQILALPLGFNLASWAFSSARQELWSAWVQILSGTAQCPFFSRMCTVCFRIHHAILSFLGVIIHTVVLSRSVSSVIYPFLVSSCVYLPRKNLSWYLVYCFFLGTVSFQVWYRTELRIFLEILLGELSRCHTNILSLYLSTEMICLRERSRRAYPEQKPATKHRTHAL